MCKEGSSGVFVSGNQGLNGCPLQCRLEHACKRHAPKKKTGVRHDRRQPTLSLESPFALKGTTIPLQTADEVPLMRRAIHCVQADVYRTHARERCYSWDMQLLSTLLSSVSLMRSHVIIGKLSPLL